MLRFLLLLLAACPAPVLAAASAPAPGVDGAAQAARVLGVLVLVIGLILGLAAVLRRHGGVAQKRVPGAISVLSATSIGARERLLLVEVGGQQVLLGAAPGRIQTLLVLDEPVAGVEQVQGAPGFAAQLRAALGGARGGPRP